DLRRGELEATLAADLNASDWARIAPELTVVDAFKGRITSAFAFRNGKASVDRFSASLEGTKTPAALRLVLTRPIDPAALPRVPVATLSLEHWPLQWLNPWLVSSRVVIDPAEVGGAWNVTFGPDRILQLASGRA